jgi:FAD/FMN-containing dehydrogenase
LAVDQVLEWEVITAEGKLITALKSIRQDLYWALCAGGGGTYGIVISMPVKLHDPLSVAAASVSFAQPTTATGEKDFWDAVTVFINSVPSLADARLEVIWTVLPDFVTAIKEIVTSDFLFVGLTLDMSRQDASAVSANPY